MHNNQRSTNFLKQVRRLQGGPRFSGPRWQNWKAVHWVTVFSAQLKCGRRVARESLGAACVFRREWMVKKNLKLKKSKRPPFTRASFGFTIEDDAGTEKNKGKMTIDQYGVIRLFNFEQEIDSDLSSVGK